MQPEPTGILGSPDLFKAEGRGERSRRDAPVWPTNTIRICQSASHTFTVLSREAVTMASTSLQYARSETVLGVEWGEAPAIQHRLP